MAWLTSFKYSCSTAKLWYAMQSTEMRSSSAGERALATVRLLRGRGLVQDLRQRLVHADQGRLRVVQRALVAAELRQRRAQVQVRLRHIRTVHLLFNGQRALE